MHRRNAVENLVEIDELLQTKQVLQTERKFENKNSRFMQAYGKDFIRLYQKTG